MYLSSTFTFFQLSCIIHKKIKLCFQFIDLDSRYLSPLKRSVVDNVKVTSYDMASRVMYEWGTFKGASKRCKEYDSL
jgi:hypothetical protein